MPLTVYLFTSLLMMWVVFAPWGLDMFGRWGMAELMAGQGMTAVDAAEGIGAGCVKRVADAGGGPRSGDAGADGTVGDAIGLPELRLPCPRT